MAKVDLVIAGQPSEKPRLTFRLSKDSTGTTSLLYLKAKDATGKEKNVLFVHDDGTFELPMAAELEGLQTVSGSGSPKVRGLN